MKATVLMRQPGRVQEIVDALRRGGGDRLQVPGRGVRPGGCLSRGLPASWGARSASLVMGKQLALGKSLPAPVANFQSSQMWS